VKLKKSGFLFFIICSVFFQGFVYADPVNDPLGLYNNVYTADYSAEAGEQNDNKNEKYDVCKMTPYEETTSNVTTYTVVNQKNVYFENRDYYWFRRYVFKDTVPGARITSAFNISGNSIEIRFVDPVTKQWVLTSDLNKIKNVKNTLFINTDTTSMILSVPGVYKNLFPSNTLEVVRAEEAPVSISKTDGAYTITFSFPRDSSKIGEIWCLQSQNKLIDWNNQFNYNYLKTHDLALERRWSWDGYYFQTPSNYVPGGENILYRHPANYTGASFAKYSANLAALDLGYVMTKVCLENQNSEGFWATGPMSQWLNADFGINGNFYDTRFSTDFAISLVFAYKKYLYQPFLDGAIKYAEYFLKHAQNNHYDVNDGWLVEDYAPSASQTYHVKTHTSLNHQVNEMNFLYYLYNETKDSRYYETADKMLKAIEYTKNKWVLSDGNLNYALMYNGTNNIMVDYPYLTYNDLFDLKAILAGYGIQNITINYLMESKKAYMDRVGITEYKKE